LRHDRMRAKLDAIAIIQDKRAGIQTALHARGRRTRDGPRVGISPDPQSYNSRSRAPSSST
jgi:hypothetical protein